MCEVVGLGSCSALLQLAMHAVSALFFRGIYLASTNPLRFHLQSWMPLAMQAALSVPLGYKRKPTKQRIKTGTKDKKKQNRGTVSSDITLKP